MNEWPKNNTGQTKNFPGVNAQFNEPYGKQLLRQFNSPHDSRKKQGKKKTAQKFIFFACFHNLDLQIDNCCAKRKRWQIVINSPGERIKSNENDKKLNIFFCSLQYINLT